MNISRYSVSEFIKEIWKFLSGALVVCCCITNYPQLQHLKTINACCKLSIAELKCLGPEMLWILIFFFKPGDICICIMTYLEMNLIFPIYLLRRKVISYNGFSTLA